MTESELEYEQDSRTRDELVRKMALKPGLKGKIDAFCVSCIYDPRVAGTWRLQVQLCTAKDCPLYSVRPQSKYKETLGE